MTDECARHRERFSEYLDGELAGAEREALQAHLERCGACQRELEALRRTVRAVGSLPERRAPEGFAARVVRRLGREAAAPRPEVLAVLWTRVLPVAAMLALVLGLTLTVSRNGVFRREAAPERLAMARRAGEELARVGARPVATDTVFSLAEGQEARREPAAGAEPAAATGWGGLTGRAEAMREGVRTSGRVARMRQVRGLAPGTGAAAAEAPVAAKAVAAPKEARLYGAAEARETIAGAAAEALTWRDGEALREAAAGGRAALHEEAGERTDMGLTGALGVPTGPMFDQMSVEGGLARTELQAADRQPVQQVVNLTGDDPARLARRAVSVANENGVPAALMLGEDKAGGVVEVYLSVPPVQYDALLRGLAALAPPRSNVLSNTAAAKEEFFRAALDNYTYYQTVAAPAARLTVEDAHRAVGLEMAARPAAEAEAPAPAGAEPPVAVNMVIRISRPATDQ